MGLKARIYKAINETPHDEGQYTSFDDNPSYSTYSGLVEEVMETMEDEGENLDTVTDSVIEDYVFDLIN